MTAANKYMGEALQLARKGLYTTDPNPRVGCVLVKDDCIVGRGWHERAGGPHAEIIALRDAAEAAQGATAYVTLEPCSHQGRTPPCADALIAAGVARIIVAMQDPNPLVAGKGIERLRAAGIDVETGILAAQAADLNPGFVSRMTRQRPWVRCKLAMSLDGRTAMASGESQWISSDASRLDVQRLRARSSAILTGMGTVLADDPSMNVRLTAAQLDIDGEVRQPLRVVLDRQLQLSPQAKIVSLPGDMLVLTAMSESDQWHALEDAGVQVVECKTSGHHLDLAKAVEKLAAMQINELLLESGSHLAGAMLQANLIDEFIIYIAPHLMGDAAQGLVHLPGLASMRDRIALTLTDVRQIGEDVRLTLAPKKSG
ncbi:MAG: bifunctional diaminohydroxyphosphoribosylaminopyrimidine deaminase/5-amino-6-(5-phosphoribosylamino)uracil reductase RibD [Gammaproteobacteria bacterium]